MAKRAVMLLLALSLGLFSFAWSKVTLDVKEKTLKNGLKILVVENHTAPVVSCLMRFKVGSVDEHPGITFRSGPAGRRPGLVGGPDVWEVVAVFRSFEDVQRTAHWLDQPASTIETALRYYDAHRDDIDDWIRWNEEAAEAAERIARARQAAF